MEDIRECRVCCATSDGTHFGVDACRACAAFFRRTVVLSKRYVCRQGNNNCKVHTTTRMCRNCRLTKCYAVGMQPDHVQNRPKSDLEQEESIPRLSFIRLDLNCSPSSSIEECTSHLPITLEFLSNVAKNYRHLEELQILTEDGILRKQKEGNYLKPNFAPGSFFHLISLARVGITSTIEFIKNSFRTFCNMGVTERITFLRYFSTTFYTLQCAFISFKNLEDDSEKSMVTQLTYVDRKDPNLFFKDTPSKTMQLFDFPRRLGVSMEKNLPIMKMIRRLNITEIEVSALISLAMWDPKANLQNGNIAQIAERERETVFDELEIYYRDVLKIASWGRRLGELMCLFSLLESQTALIREEMIVYNVMDMFELDPFAYDLMSENDTAGNTTPTIVGILYRHK